MNKCQTNQKDFYFLEIMKNQQHDHIKIVREIESRFGINLSIRFPSDCSFFRRVHFSKTYFQQKNGRKND